MLSLSCSLGPRLEPKQAIRLSNKQKLEVKNKLLALKLNLISNLNGVIYTPGTLCPTCKYKLTLVEVLKGYSGDPTNLHTTCPKCKEKFIAKLHSGAAELIWYCPDQALHEIIGKQYMTPAEILKWKPAVYHSILSHFGNIKNAFKKIGVEYNHKPLPDWQMIVRPFLGLIPDAEISRILGIKIYLVRELRQAMGITKYCKKKLLKYDLND